MSLSKSVEKSDKLSELSDNLNEKITLDVSDIDSESSSEDEKYEYEGSDAEEPDITDMMTRLKTEREIIKAKEEKELGGFQSKFIGQGSTGASRRIMGDLKRMLKVSPEYGIRAEIAGDVFYKWHVYFFNFDRKDKEIKDFIADLDKAGIKEIKLEVTFPEDYPSRPPFVRVITPRFVMRTARVTIGGSICTEELTTSGEGGWKPTNDMEFLMISLRAQILGGQPRLDFAKSHPYTMAEAEEAFRRIAVQKGWQSKFDKIRE